MDDFQEAIAIIDGIRSVANPDELNQLDAALDKLFQAPEPERGIETLFHLYERFPDDDGYGVFWTALHGLEKLPGYEPYLKESIRRVPMEFNLLMVNRILNSALSNDERQKWLSLLAEVEVSPNANEITKRQATHFIEYQNDHINKSETK